MSTAASPASPRRKASDTHSRVLEVARRLFVTRGIDAVSYGDIAKEVGSTRANLHYHFGNKSELVRQVFAATFEEVHLSLEKIWLTPALSLEERLDRLFEDLQARFREFNQTDDGGTPWSLTSRARFDFSSVSPEVAEGMKEMSRFFEECVEHAVQLAISSGELQPETRIKDVVLIITPLWYFGSPTTQFSGIRRLEDHFKATRRIIKAAYGA
ncbi:TetR/AcrR family transcriptional regulator [Marinobacter adhaerens]|uniref:TetR/AcrR family transcriptional regulator n=1 Tax=Marinobacter adhaerens TaxID=1033846 RepID=A0A851HW72_9GAMM|nr:TetR/AcrR family transcriptional regulator [Marinobacter adhaerens]NWN91836.1 TetR/AcrR family transcriptional regulator [Marinobacter adhaerens]